MKVRFFAVALACIGLACLARADDTVIGSGLSGIVNPGPLNLGIGSPSSFWALRCGSVAYAGNVADVWDAATGSTTETLIKCTSGGGLTQTVNPLSTTCASACVVATIYDQIGSTNLTNATNSTRPTFVNNVNPKLWAMTFNGSSSILSNASLTLTGPNSFAVVGITTGNFASTGVYMGSPSGGNTPSIYHSGTNANGSFCGSGNPGATATDNALHVSELVCNTTATLYVDNIAGTSQTGVGSIAGAFNLGTNGSNFLTGKIVEGGIWNKAFSTTERANLCHNEYAYWATGTAC